MMNQLKNQILKNKLLNYISHNYRSGNKEGYVKVHSNNTLEHERTKLEVCYELKKRGFDFWTECEFKTKGRADIVAIKNGKGYIIEVLHSEKEKYFENKKNYYPEEFEIIKIDTKTFKNEDLLI